MNSQIRLQWITLLICLATALSVKAQNEDDVYLYFVDGTSQVLDLNTLHKITFSEQNINLHFDYINDDIQTISYDTLISFKKKSSGVETVEIGDIRLYMRPPYVAIECDDIIMEYRVYNLHGLQLITETVNANSASISLEHISSGIYIIHVATQHRTHNFKILK